MVIFYKKWKKYNEIQLTKHKMDLNIRKITTLTVLEVWNKNGDMNKPVLMFTSGAIPMIIIYSS